MIRCGEVAWSLAGTALVRWWHSRHFQKQFQKPVLRFGVLITGASWRRVDEQMKMQSSTRIIQLIERSESNGPITYWTVITLNGPWDMGVLILTTETETPMKLNVQSIVLICGVVRTWGEFPSYSTQPGPQRGCGPIPPHEAPSLRGN